ncbi:hypothetical protein BaRGS_00015986, partial [Batillaria attramentaria]
IPGMTSPSDASIKAKESARSGTTIVPSDLSVPTSAHPISRSLQNLKYDADDGSNERDGKRVGSADNATQRERESGTKKVAKHRRCHSQSIVPSAGLSLPPPARYMRSQSANVTEQGGGEATPLVICDEAVSVEEVYGGRGQKLEGLPPRLLVVSSRVRNISVLRHALLPGVSLLQYNYETQSLEDILSSVSQTLNGRQVHSIAFITSCLGASIPLTSSDDKVLNRDTVQDKSITDFLTQLKEEHCNKEASSGMRLDFLACTGLQQGEAALLAQDLESKLEVPVGVWRDLVGADLTPKKADDTSSHSTSCVAELYFRLERLRSWSGAYGAAVLYKKKDDDSLVILKEINMHDLTAAERQLALNEVRVLAMLDHPNIISYFDSFEEDGVLMIEMEYADGGTLAQYLSQQDASVSSDREREVLTMFQQIVAAIRHIHEHNILHSPEMCEGKPYSYKSDIWALGCILYEMACLQKTFEGSNLPALVNKIMKGQFAPVKENYSTEFRDLVCDMLQRDPDLRPSANDIMYTRLPQLMSKFEDPNSDPEDELMASAESISRRAKIRSVLYYLESSTGTMTCITGLPPRMKIRQVGVSSDHVVVVTTEQQVYSWGRGEKGQLGHGDTKSCPDPCLVEALKGKSITMACCGDGFSVFGSDNGLVLTCGDGSTGCLGHGDWAQALKPRLIEALLSVDVVVVTCGPRHVAVVGREGGVFCWGQGDRGQLGLGTEDSHCQPMRVQIEEPVVFRDVKCGVDGTMFLTDMGGVFACGSNQHNKLGLNNRQGFLMTEVEGRNIPTPVRALARHRVVSVAMGPHHSAVIVEAGHVYTFGRNSEGQLGTGNVKATHAPMELKSLSDKSVNHVQCGDHFSVASTRDHQLYYWGLRYTAAQPRHSTGSCNANTTDEGSSRSSIGSLAAEVEATREEGREEITPRNVTGPENVELRTGSFVDASEQEEGSTQPGLTGSRGDSGVAMTTGSGEGTDNGMPGPSPLCDTAAPGFRPLSETMARRSLSAGSRDNGKEKDRDKEKEIGRDDSVILLEPVEIIRIKQANEKVLLGNVFCHGENLFIQVETTAPPPRRRTFKKRSFRRRPYGTSDLSRDPKQLSASSHEAGDEYSSEASEIDSQTTVPTWLRDELSGEIEDVPRCHDNDDDGNEADDTSDLTDDDSHTHVMIDSSMSSIQINRVLTPVKGGGDALTPRPAQPFVRSSQLAMSASGGRDRASSINSTESNPDRASAEHTDSSSSETAHIRNGNRELTVPYSASHRGSVSSAGKTRGLGGKLSRGRSAGRGKSKSHEEVLKERLAARGFVSDVTVKRREEALLCELELMREEKKRAETELQALQRERELQAVRVRQEAERLAKEREEELRGQVEALRRELEKQSLHLEDHQRLVGHLQEQLQQAQQQPPRALPAHPNGFVAPPPTPRQETVPPQHSTPPPSARRGNHSARSTGSSSKVCSVQ